MTHMRLATGSCIWTSPDHPHPDVHHAYQFKNIREPQSQDARCVLQGMKRVVNNGQHAGTICRALPLRQSVYMRPEPCRDNSISRKSRIQHYNDPSKSLEQRCWQGGPFRLGSAASLVSMLFRKLVTKKGAAHSA